MRWWLAVGSAVACALAMGHVAYARGVPGFVAAVGVDKALHFAMGAILAGLLDGALRGRGVVARGRAATMPLAALLVIVPVGIEEWAQRFSTTRTSCIEDFLADVFGVIVGIGLSRWARRPRVLAQRKPVR